jgi:LmbE family N-acetylglucosaminyl deacetylase
MLSLNSLDNGEVRRILFIGAHADDIEIGCGGAVQSLLARWPEVHVSWVVLSANNQRTREAENSASELLQHATSREIHVAHFRESFFPYQGAEIKDYFNTVIRDQEPDIVFTHFGGDRHQDHRLVWELTWNTFRNHLVCEYEIVKFEGDLASPNLFVPLTSEQVALKCDHIWQHFVSQRGKPWFSDDTFRAIARIRGVECNAEDGFAEAFHCRKLVL